MRTHFRKFFVICAAALLMLAWGMTAHAVDPPHVPPLVNCVDCHTSPAFNDSSGGNIDKTPYNNVCLSCHNGSKSWIPQAATHSSNNLDTTFGQWTYQCIDCHNPHYQEQARTYPSAYSSGGSWLVSGIINGLTNSVTPGVYNVVTVNPPTPAWTTNQWVGYTLIANPLYNLMYRIYNSSGTALTIDIPNYTSSSTSTMQFYVKKGGQYAIINTELIKTSINTRKPIANSDGHIYNANTTRSVKFFNSSGAHSLAPSITDANAICIVCHTKTPFMNIGYAIYGNSFSNVIDPDTGSVTDYFSNTHASGHVSTTSDCWSQSGCHQKHKTAFAGGAQCGTCHGTTLDGLDTTGASSLTADLVKKFKNATGLQNTTTGSASVYAHPAHLKKAGISNCYLCHDGGMDPKGTDTEIGDNMIEIQFSGYAANPVVGTYDGRSTLANGFTYNGTSVGSVGVQPGATGTGTMQCDNVYCHSDGGNYSQGSWNYTSPRWTDGPFNFPTDCNKCHGQTTPNVEYVLTDRHPKHVGNNTSSNNYAFKCVECHAATVNGSMTIIDNSVHVNGQRDVVFGGSIATIGATGSLYNGSSLDTGNNGECINIYCHSSANPINGGTNKYATPSWASTAALNCGSCHSKQGDASPTWSSPHTTHVDSYYPRIQCNACHSLTASSDTSVIDTSAHVNGIKNVVFSGGGVYNSTTHECSNVACHGGNLYATPNNPKWTDSVPQNCGYCHSKADSLANLKIQNRLSPSHFEHVATDEYGNPARGSTKISCENCHKGTTDNGTSINSGGLIGNHVDFVNTVQFNITMFNGTATGSWSGSVTQSCSNTYCHGSHLAFDANEGGLINGGQIGQNQNPSWNDSTYLLGNTTTADFQHDCNQCHGAPPTGYSGSPHQASWGFSKCNQCHKHVYPTDDLANGWIANGTAFSNSLLHVNGVVEGAGCTSCHGQPPMDASTVLQSSYPDTGRAALFPASGGAGAHAVHNSVGFGENKCDYCHSGGGSGGDHQTKNINIGFTHVQTQGIYNAPALSNGFQIVNTSPTVATTTGSVRQCSNIYCHSDGNGNYASPKWDDTWASGSPGFPTACDQCHGDHTGSGNYVLTSRHPKHVGTYGFECVDCHAATVNTNIANIHYNNQQTTMNLANHVDGIKNVLFGGMVADSGSWNSTTKDCSNIYCHSNGTSNTPSYSGLTVPNWGSAVPATCTDCHGNDHTSAPASEIGNTAGAGSKRHINHIDNPTHVGKYLGCADCHSATATNNSTIGNPVNHVNKLVNIKFDNAINNNADGPIFNGLSATIANGAVVTPGDTSATCSNVYCHSRGNLDAPFGNVVNPSSSYKTPAWNDTFTNVCTECHGTKDSNAYPDYANGGPGTTTANSHPAHVGGSGLTCDNCHIQTTTDTTLPPQTVINGGDHLNRQEDVFFKTISGKSGTYNADKSCSNTYCHGPSGPQWGGASLACNGCHGATNNGDLSGKHYLHYNSANPPSDRSDTDSPTSTGYVFGCGNCHPNGTTHATGPVSANFRDAEINGTMIALANYAAGATNTTDNKNFNYTVGGTCTTYCHSGGVVYNDGSTPIYNSPKWSDTPTGNCNVCHNDHTPGTVINTNSHTVHVNNSTYNFDCEECHGNTTTGTGDGVINSISRRTYHDNGTNDVYWKSGGRNNGGSAYTSGTHSCSGIYCHSKGDRDLAPYNTGFTTPTWGGSMGPNCTGCHGNDSTSGTAIASGKHTNHIDTVSVVGRNLACTDCHAATVSDNRTINGSSYANHVNKLVNIKFDNVTNKDTDGPIFNGVSATLVNGAVVTPGDYTATCSNVYCHSNGNLDFATGNLAQPATDYKTPAWDGTTTYVCASCHGDGTNAYPTYTSGPKGSTTANSHQEHVVNGGITCNVCHDNTVSEISNTPSSVIPDSSGGLHLNRTKDVNSTDITGGYDYSTKTCTTITCHGSNSAQWGDTALSCESCHLSAGPAADVDDFARSGQPNGTMALINSTAWTGYGHGQASVGLIANADGGNGDPCLWCHDATPKHTDTLNSGNTNPFRLRSTPAIAGNLNDYCLVCHATSQTGIYTPLANYSLDLSTMPASSKIDKWHYGTSGDHSATDNGGQYCWDCHDPHGDNQNIMMIQARPARTSDADGVLTNSPSTDVVFTNDNLGTGAGGFAIATGTQSSDFEKGLCNTCHEYAKLTTKTYYYDNPSATIDHHVGELCTACHHHQEDTAFDGDAWKGSGGESTGGSSCSGCHTDFFSSDTTKASMHGDLARINYKHYMNNTGVGAIANSTKAGASYYPIDNNGTLKLNGANLQSRRCLMCHVDHDIFSPANNSNSYRAANLRTSINDLPVTSVAPGIGNGFNNTDFDPNNTDGGICISCHYKSRAKHIVTPNDATATPAIPFEMSGSDTERLTKSVEVMRRSTHAYFVNGAAFGDSSGFKAVCLKCHNDTIGQNWGPKSIIERQVDKLKGAQQTTGECDDKNNNYALVPPGTISTPEACEQARTTTPGAIWNGTPAFGRHISSNDSSLAVLGAEFEQGTVSQASTISTVLNRDTSLPQGSPGDLIGKQVVITSGKCQQSRATIVDQPTANHLVVNSPGFINGDAGGTASCNPDTSSKYDIVTSPLPEYELCFSCHSKQGENKISPDLRDWYNQHDMKEILTRMKNIFVGDSGVNQKDNTKNDTQIYLCTAATVVANQFDGYQYQSGSFGAKVITTYASTQGSANCSAYPNYPNYYYFDVSGFSRASQVLAGNAFELFKPAYHPLDAYGRHKPYERTTAGKFWNVGDEGSFTTASTLTDSTKGWIASEWAPANAPAQMYLYIASGASLGQRFQITDNTATDLIIAGSPTLADGDAYYIGTATEARHVTCFDCHNTHASTNNPEGDFGGTGDSATSTSLTSHLAIDPYGTPNKWKGHLLKVRDSGGLEQIRFVTASDESTGSFTVAPAWATTPVPGSYTFELLMGDIWNSSGQTGGIAGSGSAGVWGVNVSGWTTPAVGSEIDTSNLTYTKEENVSDLTGNYGGAANAAQRDLCVRCHSYYAYGTSPAVVPSGNADGSAVTETDVLKEFNPNNLTHHAVYARGNNQPIRASYGNINVTSAYNPNWPTYSNGDITISGGTATLATGSLPDTVLPGWFIYIGSTTAPPSTPTAGSPTTGFLEIYEIDSSTTFKVRAETSNPMPYSLANATWDYNVTLGTNPTANWFITAGLGNTFVPPYGPWSINRCTDCHGSTKTDPVGPHASVNSWLIKDADLNLQFYWMSTSGSNPTYQLVNYGNILTDATTDVKYVCFNCHRADVYPTFATAVAKSAVAHENLGRLQHQTDIVQNDYNHITGSSYQPYWPQYCRNCHGGNVIGGIHGSNNAESKRFLNGAAWGQGPNHDPRPSSGNTTLNCYFSSSSATTVTNCNSGHTNHNATVSPQYDYDFSTN